MLTRIVAGIILIIMTYTWSQISIQVGYPITLTEGMREVGAILLTAVGGIGAAEKWGGKK